MIDLLDDLLGPINYLSRMTGWLQIQFRRGSKRRRQKFSRTATVRVRVPWCDRAPVQSHTTIVNHLRRHGVKIYAYTHDSQYWYCSVPKNQEKWFWWLYNNGALRAPKSAWGDKR